MLGVDKRHDRGMTLFTQRRRSLAAIVAASALVLGSTTIAQAVSQEITWEDCPEAVNEPGVECGRIDVPMNYSDPQGKKINVGLVKLPAKEKSRGSVFVNPGGPGSSVYELFSDKPVLGLNWSDEIRNEWDIIAVQPRGLKGSTPLECSLPADMSPSTMANFGGKLKEDCDRKNAGYAENVNTENTASDWDEVRRALGEEKISILGMSYGTFLGSVYATKFPQHTDKVILDSGYNPDADGTEQLRGFDEAFTDFFTWVSKHDDVYHMGNTPEDVYEKWASRIEEESGARPTVAPPNAGVLKRAETDAKGIFSQITGGDSQAKSTTLAYTKAHVPMPATWPQIAKAISSANPIELPEWAQDSSSQAMTVSVLCNDRKPAIRPDELASGMWSQITGDVNGQAHLMSSGILCRGIEPTQPARDLSGAGLATKPLQIQATRDPNTPYWNFSKMSDAMHSHVLTVEGPGHVQYRTGNQDLNRIIGEYLRSGKVTETRIAGIDPKPE